MSAFDPLVPSDPNEPPFKAIIPHSSRVGIVGLDHGPSAVAVQFDGGLSFVFDPASARVLGRRLIEAANELDRLAASDKAPPKGAS